LFLARGKPLADLIQAWQFYCMDENTEQTPIDPRRSNLREPWRKGESGNPNGRPKGARSMKNILRDILEIELKNEPDPIIPEYARNMSVGEKLMLTWVSKGLADADLKAIKDIYEATEGKPFQATSVEGGDPDKPVVTRGKLDIAVVHVNKGSEE
jgi:hypothetical protein